MSEGQVIPRNAAPRRPPGPTAGDGEAGRSTTDGRRVVVVFADGPSQMPSLAEVRDILADDERLRVVPIGLDAAPGRRGAAYSRGLYRRLLTHTVRPLLLGAVLRRRWLAYCERLTAEGADLVVVAEDNVGGRSRIMVAAAEACGVPVLVVPFTIPNRREFLNVLTAQRGHRVRGPLQRAFLSRHPDWGHVDSETGGTVLRLPLVEAWQMQRVGFAPRHPWNVGEGAAVRVAVDGEVARDAHLACGAEAERLTVTGGALDDRLYRAAADPEAGRRELYAELDLEPGRPLLLVAFPPDQITGGAAPKAPCADFAELATATLSALSAASGTFNVVIRPHPRLDAARFAGVGDSHVAVTERDTADLVPLCNLYVAAGSATIRWALALGRPVIDYDCFRYELGDYAGAAGVRQARDAGELEALLREAARDLDGTFGGRSAREADARRWGVIDGRAGERLRTLVHAMAGTGRS